MSKIERQDVVGRRIAEIIVSVPDRPVSMSDQSFSASYIKLDSGLVIDLSSCAPPLEHYDECLDTLKRDSKYEAEFQPAVGQKIADVLLTKDVSCICIVTDGGFLITDVPAQFWQRPCIFRTNEFSQATKPLWKT